MSEAVDITGTLAKAKPGWQERTELLARPEYFNVSITISAEAADQLTPEEQVRLSTKLKLVAEYARYMSAGMVKGTVKYTGDDYPLSQWMAHLIGEGADIANYSILLFNKWSEDKAAHDAQVAALVSAPSFVVGFPKIDGGLDEAGK